MKAILYFLCFYIFMNTSFGQSPTPFTCSGPDGFGFYISSATTNSVGNDLTYSSSRLSSLLTITGVRSTLCTAAEIGVSLNALAFNPLDKYLYAVSRYDATQFSGKLYRIGENCQKAQITVTGGIVSFNTNNRNTIDAAGGNLSSGTFDLNNNYYVNTSFTNTASTGFTNKIQKIAISGSTATVVSTQTLTCSTCTNEVQVTDIIFDESTGKIYGSNKITNTLYSINVSTGAMTPIGMTGITGAILGIYKNQSGAVRAIDDSGNIYSVNISTGAFTYLNTSTALNSSNADAASGCFGQAHISGYLFIDANGLIDLNVNGTGTGKAGTTTLYANLVQNNLIVNSTPILADGSYQFLGFFSGSYEVQISSTLGVFGTAPPPQGLPSTYAFVGDFIGTTSGNDGSPNGKLSFSISPAGSSVENVNFGIDAKPVANDVSAPTQPNPGGTIKVAVPSLSVTDIEDGVPTTIVIGTIPDPTTKGVLYYNNIAVTNNQVITNFQASLFQFDPVEGAVNVTFDYTAKDAAGISSNTAIVTMDFSVVLPIDLISFKGRYMSSHVALTWMTSSEENSDVFIIERSISGRDYVPIGVVKAGGSIRVVNEYSFEDKAPNTDNYYRLKMVDLDGKIYYSSIISINLDKEILLKVYPTVFDEGIFINGNQAENQKIEVSIFYSDGTRVFSTMLSEANQFIHLQHISAGLYYVRITNKQNGEVVAKEIIKN